MTLKHHATAASLLVGALVLWIGAVLALGALSGYGIPGH